MLITAEQVEDRVESVRASEKDQLSSTGDSEKNESSSAGKKTDGELIEFTKGVYTVVVQLFKLRDKLLVLVSVYFTTILQCVHVW